MRRRQAWAAASALPTPVMVEYLTGDVGALTIEFEPGDDVLPEPKRKPGWQKGRKRK